MFAESLTPRPELENSQDRQGNVWRTATLITDSSFGRFFEVKPPQPLFLCCHMILQPIQGEPPVPSSRKFHAQYLCATCGEPCSRQMRCHARPQHDTRSE